VYLCDSCGAESPKWEGRCPSCGQWNTLAEFKHGARDSRHWTGASAPAVELSEVQADDVPRVSVGSQELNRVLGGGIVPGSVTLVAGDPGIGKSTLLLRLASDAARILGQCLYVTGEESASQIRMRADRLGLPGKGLYILQATELAEIRAELATRRPPLVVVDSIQTLSDEASSSSPGSSTQIRECTRALLEWAKSEGAPVVITGHVTKGGDIAGPRVLEHMVDVVLYMEGDPISSWRLLRSAKNRFGSTNELGVFEMRSEGLVDVPDPSQVFLGERRKDAVGSVVVATIEGTRPLLVEVQALTNPSLLPAPRRVATGVDFNRLLLVCAVLTRRTGISLADQDVVVSVTGGLRVSEPAADLGIALAVASSMRNAPIPSGLVAFGEIGLAGEIRAVPQAERRIAEAERLGLTRHVSAHPSGNGAGAGRSVGTLGEALSYAIPRSPRRTAPEIEMGVPRG
jgi:DNA repair protein RadA/Sms